MKAKRVKVVQIWLLTIILAGAAFWSGKHLRSAQDKPLLLIRGASPQANALLKLAPEQAPIQVESIKPKPQVGAEAEYRNLFSTVLNLCKKHYVEKITPEKETKMAQSAVRAMLESLDDPDTRLITPEERKLLDDVEAGIFHGTGAILALKNEKIGELETTNIVVVAPMPGSPAEEAGLEPGDAIIEVGGKWVINHDPYMEPEIQKMRKMVRNKQLDILSYRKALDEVDARLKKGITIQDALDKLTTTTSGDLNIEIEKPGKSNRIKVKLRCRDTIVDPVVARELKGGITYIRIAQFNKRAEKEFTAEISKAQARKAKALILDVRNNPGGSISSATYIASKLTGGGTLATIQGRNTKRSIRLPKTRNIGIPVVVLVNGGTSSVAELFAGTLRDSQIATILGTKTFGDGLVQTPVVLKDGASAIVTTGKMITAGGIDFDKRGLDPDVTVESKNRKEDVQLAAAEKLLIGKAGSSKG